MSLEKFEINEMKMKPITEIFWESQRHCRNTSSILTKLIQECGRLCESHASDLFIDWNIINDKIDDMEIFDGQKFLFGIREYGVDHAEWIKNNMDNPYYYREILILEVNIEECEHDNRIILTLGKF